MRVILVDDAPLVRAGIASLLTEAGIEVVDQRSNAVDLMSVVPELRPDVVIMDVRMPPTHTTEGLRAAVQLKAAWPGVGVLILSQHVESRHVVDLLGGSTTGVGYLLKERVARPAELVDAVSRVAGGGTAVDPEVVRTVFRTRRAPDPLDLLTSRERDVLELVAEGLSNATIADRLNVNVRTVETHMTSIFVKLGIKADDSTHRRVLAVLTYLRARSAN